jgi:hypothetical protein
MFNGMIVSDPFATFFRWLFLSAAVEMVSLPSYAIA